MSESDAPNGFANPWTILWIDDDAPAHVIVRSLSSEGAQLTVANTGAAGLDLGEAHLYDCIVVDLHLPDFHGLTVVERLRATGVCCPILAVTGYYLDPEAPQHAHAAGATAFRYKPLWLDELPELLRELLASPECLTSSVSTSSALLGGACPDNAPPGTGEMFVSHLQAKLHRLTVATDRSQCSRDSVLRVLLSALTEPALSLSAFSIMANACRATLTAPGDARAAQLAARACDELREATGNVENPSHPAVKETLRSLISKPRWRQEEELAEELGTTRGHLSRLVHEELGVDYRTLRRLAVMKEGAVRILTTAEQVAQIAHQLHVHPGHFDQMFHATFGCSPREFRRHRDSVLG